MGQGFPFDREAFYFSIFYINPERGAHMAESKTVKIGTELLVEALAEQNVDHIFGYPGGAVLHIYDQFFKTGENHILARHEQGAAHMADGYARATGKTGVCIVTSGPGATNTVTGVATAMMDSVPMVVITGQVAEDGIGKDAFQETDIIGVMTPITKYCFQVRHAREIPRIVAEAFYIANSGRKGPVLIDIPKNIGVQEVTMDEVSVDMDLPGYQPDPEVDMDAIRQVMTVLENSHKPLILVGAGVAKSQASQDLREFANRYQIPVASTLLGLGTMPADSDLFTGMAGMHGTYASNMALMECDCLINIGSRFDDRVATKPDDFAPEAKIVHIDIDAAEMGKTVRPDYPVVADAKTALQIMLQIPMPNYQVNQDWLDHVQANKDRYPYPIPASDHGMIRPQEVLKYLGERTAGEAYIVTDVGQHQMWAGQFYPYKHPAQLITSGGLGTMGFGVPATIGAAFGEPDKTVVGIVGDGGFQMTNQELNIIQHYDIKPKFIILNNTVLGMVHQWQQAFYDDRYSHSEFGPGLPDFVKLSEALGVKAARVTDPADMQAAIDTMLDYDGAYVLEVMIDKYETVLPMIAPGKANNEMEGIE